MLYVATYVENSWQGISFSNLQFTFRIVMYTLVNAGISPIIHEGCKIFQ